MLCRLVNEQLQESGVSAAYLAAQDGQLEVLRYLAEEGGATLRLLAFDGMSCLHAAAQMGHLHCAQWLVLTSIHTPKGCINCNE
jgi:hypothetical protein